MNTAKAIGAMAVVLGAVQVAGYAGGEDKVAASPVKQAPAVAAKAEADKRALAEEKARRKDQFERACSRPLNTDTEKDLCRTAYKRMNEL